MVCLRKSPSRTSAFLAANRHNAQKCTGPRTVTGKARSSLNALKHGKYAVRLPEKLLAAGYCGRATLHAHIREEIKLAFRVADHRLDAQVERLANAVFATARRAGVFGTKPECPLLSASLGPRSWSYSRFAIRDPWSRTGLVYWVQRKRFWTVERLFSATLCKAPAAEPPLRQMLEQRLRHRVYRTRRPSIWELEKCGGGKAESRMKEVEDSGGL
jgi:hypothetical protein